MNNTLKKPVKITFIKDPRAIALINERAARENRSACNAATTTVIEALGETKTQNPNDTASGPSEQDKNSA